MAVIKLRGFLGEVPIQDSGYLEDIHASRSRNMLPWVDYLTPIRKLKFEQSLSAVGATVYRHFNKWLTWSERTHVVKSPIAGDVNDLLYFSNSTGFKVTNGVNTFDVGVPIPTTALTTSATTGTFTYYYVYTYVNIWGQESAPSPPRLARSNSAIPGVALTASDPATHTRAPVTHFRLYRTDIFGTNYSFVREQVITNLNITDNVEFTGEVLPTQAWSQPVAGIGGIIEMNQSCIAAFRGKQVYLSEPGVPYAWPEENTYTVKDNIVALGRVANGLVVITDGEPILLIGSDPASMVDVPLREPYGCVSARSVVQSGDVVAYAGYRGIVVVTSEGAKPLTLNLIEESDWVALNPSTIRAFHWRSHYVAIYTKDDNTYAFAVNMFAPERGVYYYDGFANIASIYEDLGSGDVYMTFVNSLLKWNAGDTHICQWRSKPYGLPKAAAMRVIKVEANKYPVKVSVYRDGALQDYREISNAKIHRLSHPTMGVEYSVEVETDGRVTEIYLGTSSAAVMQAVAADD